MTGRVFGALPLTDDTPLRKYPLSATYPKGVETVDRTLGLTNRVRRYYSQHGPLCVSFSINQLLTFHNGSLYHPGWIYYKAGGDGEHGIQTDTALQMAVQGNLLVGPESEPALDDEGAPEGNVSSSPGNPDHGINEYRWLSRDGRTAVDEARSAIAAGHPLVFAYGWWPELKWVTRDGQAWVVRTAALTHTNSWHQVCITEARDSNDTFWTPNSFGYDAGEFRLSYDDFAAMIDHGAYGATITDKVTGTEKPQPVDAPPAPKRFPCPRCKKVLKTKAKRRKHIKRRHR